MLVAEKLMKTVLEVKRVSARIMLTKLLVGKGILVIVCAYASQAGLSVGQEGKILG